MGSELKRFVARLSAPVGLFVESVFQSPRFSSTRSMWRSGMNQINATNTYKPMETQGTTNARGIAVGPDIDKAQQIAQENRQQWRQRGEFNSSTMMVMTMASTPSLNASKISIGGHCLLPISAGRSSLTGNDCSRNRSASSMNSLPQFAHSREALIPTSDATTLSFFREYSATAVTPGFMPTLPHREFAG